MNCTPELIHDSGASIFQIKIRSSVYLLFLESSHEPLRARIVIGVTPPAHADLDFTLL